MSSFLLLYFFILFLIPFGLVVRLEKNPVLSSQCSKGSVLTVGLWLGEKSNSVLWEGLQKVARYSHKGQCVICSHSQTWDVG